MIIEKSKRPTFYIVIGIAISSVASGTGDDPTRGPLASRGESPGHLADLLSSVPRLGLFSPTGE